MFTTPRYPPKLQNGVHKLIIREDQNFEVIKVANKDLPIVKKNKRVSISELEDEISSEEE